MDIQKLLISLTLTSMISFGVCSQTLASDLEPIRLGAVWQDQETGEIYIVPDVWLLTDSDDTPDVERAITLNYEKIVWKLLQQKFGGQDLGEIGGEDIGE